MLLPALLLLLLAASETPDTRPINVTGHAWAPFISPMGEPYRARSQADDTLARWFDQADRNHDGALTADEMVADAERFFATLDGDQNGEIDPDELAHYEYEIAPDIQVMAKTKQAAGIAASKPRRIGRHRRPGDDIDDAAVAIGGGFQGAARYGLLNMPEPVAAADTDFDRGISLAEFRQAALARFALLDTSHSGRLSLAQLQAIRPVITADGRAKRSKNAPDTRVGNPLPYPGN